MLSVKLLVSLKPVKQGCYVKKEWAIIETVNDKCMGLSQCTSALLKYGCLNSFWDINERGSYSFPPPAELHSFELVLLIIIML